MTIPFSLKVSNSCVVFWNYSKSAIDIWIILNTNRFVRKCVEITGFVQGVGFRPFVKNLADTLSLVGFVRNSAKGVYIEVQGEDENIGLFENDLKTKLPFPASIFTMNADTMPEKDESEFVILKSLAFENMRAYFPLDLAVCKDCLKEIFDKSNRRFGYPFTNCTSCGPRYTIISNLPYDREHTTMDSFKMCDDCLEEYNDTKNRRFHAQPNACPVCGPELELVFQNESFKNNLAIKKSAELLNDGQIIAIKGLGGYHLACSAKSDSAVRKIREIKGRDKKPFAVMASSVEYAKEIVCFNNEEKQILESALAPIVLLTRKNDELSEFTAPDNKRLGIFLPYTPVHHLLFNAGAPSALIMTSANDSSEPIVSDDTEARKRFGNDVALLTNNRPINFRDDDSVVQVVNGNSQLLRGGRGFSPHPISLSIEVDEPVLAMGGDLKNAFALGLPGKPSLAVVSPYVGDLEHPFSQDVLEKTIEQYLEIFRVKPKIIAIDKHPNYFSSKVGRKLADKLGAKTVAVQHHHAHIASVKAEHKLDGKVFGLAMDGTGYGDDETIWGAEAMVADFDGFERKASIMKIPLIGGNKAVKEPWRIAVALLANSGMINEAKEMFSKKPVDGLVEIMHKKINVSYASSLGRLFDAVSAIVLGCEEASYEAEAAILLEQVCEDQLDELYPLSFPRSRESSTNNPPNSLPRIDFSPTIVSIAKDKISGVSPSVISRKFHNTIAHALLKMTNFNDEKLPVVLSGGCFQNMLLLELTKKKLEDKEFKVYTQSLLPPNDGGISLGQASIAVSLQCDEKS